MSLFKTFNPVEMLADMEAAGLISDRQTCLDGGGKAVLIIMAFRGRDACKAADAAFKAVAAEHPDEGEEGPAYRHLDLVCAEQDNVVPFRNAE